MLRKYRNRSSDKEDKSAKPRASSKSGASAGGARGSATTRTDDKDKQKTKKEKDRSSSAGHSKERKKSRDHSGASGTARDRKRSSSRKDRKDKKKRDMLDSSDSDKDPSSSPSDADFTPSDATTPDLPEWPKTDTDGNLRRALRKEGPIVAPPFPNMTNLSAFKQAICEAVINASARSDHFRVQRWIRRVDYPKIKMRQLEDPGAHYESLDRKLAAAITRIATGEFGRHLQNIKRRVFGRFDEESGRLLSGRQILWILYKQFRTNKEMGTIFNIVDLMKVHWRGDPHIEKFRNDWEHTVVNMHHSVSRDQRATILLEQMSNSTVLKSKVDRYKKQYPNAKKSYTKLIAIMDRYIQEQRQVTNRKQLDQAQRQAHTGHATPAVKAVNCRNWLRGDCMKGKSCDFIHDKSLRGVTTKPRPSPLVPADATPGKGAKGNPKGNPKGKSKGDSKGNPKGSSKGDGKKGKGKGKDKSGKPLLCYDFNNGGCQRPNCIYKHAKASTPEEHAYLAKIGKSRSGSPSVDKRICYAWLNTGTCKHGNSCSFQHSPDKRGTGRSQTPPGGGKAKGGRGRSKSNPRKN